MAQWRREVSFEATLARLKQWRKEYPTWGVVVGVVQADPDDTGEADLLTDYRLDVLGDAYHYVAMGDALLKHAAQMMRADAVTEGHRELVRQIERARLELNFPTKDEYGSDSHWPS